MLPPKTLTAFRFTCEELFRFNRQVYFWTFTLKQVMPAWWVPNTWHHFQRAIQDRVGKFRGVRVFEWHRDHGLHIHALVNVRLDIHELRRIGARFGFGVMWVRIADENAPKYLSKYLSKEMGRMPPGMRAWATFGGCRQFGSRVRDIKTTGERADYIRARIRELKPFCTVFQAIQTAKAEYDNRLLLEVCAKYNLMPATDPDAEDGISPSTTFGASIGAGNAALPSAQDK